MFYQIFNGDGYEVYQSDYYLTTQVVSLIKGWDVDKVVVRQLHPDFDWEDQDIVLEASFYADLHGEDFPIFPVETQLPFLADILADCYVESVSSYLHLYGGDSKDYSFFLDTVDSFAAGAFRHVVVKHYEHGFFPNIDLNLVFAMCDAPISLLLDVLNGCDGDFDYDGSLDSLARFVRCMALDPVSFKVFVKDIIKYFS